MTTVARTDGELAAAARLGDRDAFGLLYQRHFSPIYDFLTRMTRDRELAGDLAQDTFVRAMQRLGQLDDPSRIRAWLYAIARSQALNRMKRESRSTPSDPTATDDNSGPLLTAIDEGRFNDPEEAARATEIADLVWEAANTLDERTFTVLDLTLRHDLGSAEIADVMGVSKGNAAVMVNRMKERAGEAIGTYLLMRQSECDVLAGIIVSEEYPPIDRELKRTVDRHVSGCEVCGERKRRVASPTQVMAAYASVPPPDGLADQVWQDLSDRWETDGPGSSGSRLLFRGIAVLTAFLLLVGLGVAGAVPLHDFEAEGFPVIAVEGTSTTSTSTASSFSTTSSTSTTTTSTTTTTLPTTTTAPRATPTTRAAPPTATTTPANTTTTLSANKAPKVTIIAPSSGAHSETSGGFFTIRFVAQVEDDHDSGLVATWESSVHEMSSGNALTFRMRAGCPALVHVVTASASDSKGATGSDSITITVGCAR